MDDKDLELENIISQAIENKKMTSEQDGISGENENSSDFGDSDNKKSGKKAKKKKKKMNKKLKIALIVLIVILSLCILIGVAFVAVAFHYINMIDVVPHQEQYEILETIPEDDDLTDEPDSPQEEIDKIDAAIDENVNNSVEELAFDDNVYNILLIGTDTRNNNERGRSDSMILISINKETEEIYMTSFMRDAYVSIPGRYNNRLNAAYAYGGAELIMDTIEQNFKVKVDKYVRVNFFSFMEVIDAVGGVEITVSDAEVEVLNFYVRELNGLLGLDTNDGTLSQGGTYNLSGKQALGYCRIRYVGNADFQRTQRQRDVLMKVFDKAKGLSIDELNDFLEVLLPKLTTNIQEDEIFSLLLSSPKFFGYEIKQLRVPADGTYSGMTINSMSVLGIDFQSNIDMLKEEIYG